MLQLAQTLYITEPLTSLHLTGNAMEVTHVSGMTDHVPLHMLKKIIVFSPQAISLPLMSRCATTGVGLICLAKDGRLKFSVAGETAGNVAVRKRQYALSDDEKLRVAKLLLACKLRGQSENMRRMLHNHPEKVDSLFLEAHNTVTEMLGLIPGASSQAMLRGLEGAAAAAYFDGFDRMVLADDPLLRFTTRTRRPPRDRCNALLSFAYTLLTHDCQSALECFGVDPYVGVLHGDRSGRPSMACDLMEIFRPQTDRHVLRLVNLRMITSDMFEDLGAEGIRLNDNGRSVFLKEWSRMKQKKQRIASDKASVSQGVFPHIQAQRFAAFLRQEEPFRIVIEAPKP